MRQDLPSRSQSQFFLSYHINVQRVRSLSCTFYSDTVYNLHFCFLIFYNLQLFRRSSKYTIDLLFFNFALFIIKCKKYNYFTIFLHKSNPFSVYWPCFFEHSQQSWGSEYTTLKSMIAYPRAYDQLNNACHQNLFKSFHWFFYVKLKKRIFILYSRDTYFVN